MRMTMSGLNNNIGRGKTFAAIASILVLCLVLGGCPSVESSSLPMQFDRDSICDLQERQSYECSISLGDARSDLECYYSCAMDSECMGASLGGGSHVCFHHRACPDVTGCTVVEIDHRYMIKKCFNDGVWDPDTGNCTCDENWTGIRCEIPPPEPVTVNSCYDLGDLGYTSGEHVVLMDLWSSIPKFRVVCYFNHRVDTMSIFVARNEGTKDFDKPWDSYRTGIYYDIKNHWLGLDNWRNLVQAGYDFLDIELLFSDEYRVEHKYYTAFSIQGASNDFKFDTYDFKDFTSTHKPSILSPHGLAFGDCMQPVERAPFSTSDVDNDGDGARNCASRDGSGWWYDNGCESRVCNLMGWSWRLNQTKPLEKLISIDGIDMSIVGRYLERIDVYLSRR